MSGNARSANWRLKQYFYFKGAQRPAAAEPCSASTLNDEIALSYTSDFLRLHEREGTPIPIAVIGFEATTAGVIKRIWLRTARASAVRVSMESAGIFDAIEVLRGRRTARETGFVLLPGKETVRDFACRKRRFPIVLLNA